MEDFIQHVESIIARNPYAAQGMVFSQQSSHPDRYHVGMALVTKATGDQAGFREHIEQAASLIEGDLPARVAELLEEARAQASEAPSPEAAPAAASGDVNVIEGSLSDAIQVVPDELDALFSREATGGPGRHPIDDLLDTWEALSLDEAEAAVAALDGDAQPVEAALGRALIAARRGDRDGFAEEVEAIEADHPDHPRVRSFMVALDADLMPDNALAAARELLADDDSGRSWEALGSTLFLMGRLDEAARAFEIASMRDVESTFILGAMAACQARVGDPIEALTLLDEASEERPEDPTPLHMARDIIRQLGWAEGALQLAAIDLSERELDNVTGTMLELFMVLVMSNPNARVLDPDLEPLSEALQARTLPEAIQERVNALLEVAEAGDEEAILAAWSVDDDAPLLFKLRHQLANGQRDEALATAERLSDAYDQALAQGLLAIDAGETTAAFEHLTAAFTERPTASATFVALQSLYAGLGEGVGSLAMGEFIEAIEEAPHGLVNRAMLDTASWAQTHTPEALADELIEVACAFFADLLSGDFDALAPETQAQVLGRAMSLGEDFIAGAQAEAEYEGELSVEGVVPKAADAIDGDEDRAAALLGVLRPAFRAVTDELVEAERSYLERVGRADLALELQARHTMVI